MASFLSFQRRHFQIFGYAQPTTLTKGGRNEPKIAIRIENRFGCMITDKVQVTQKEDK